MAQDHSGETLLSLTLERTLMAWDHSDEPWMEAEEAEETVRVEETLRAEEQEESVEAVGAVLVKKPEERVEAGVMEERTSLLVQESRCSTCTIV